MDITKEFKSSLASVKTRESDIRALTEQIDVNRSKVKNNSQKISSTSQLKEFTARVKKLVSTISKMREFLIRNRKDYINLYSPLLSRASLMSDEQRDAIDSDVCIFVKSCNNIIKNLKSEINNQKSSTQVKEHQTAIVENVEKYLKHVCDIYSQLKAVRVRRAFDKQKMSKLSGSQSKLRSSPLRVNNSINVNSNTNACSSETTAPKKATYHHFTFDDKDLEPTKSVNEIELTAEEIQVYEKENIQLFEEMNAMAEEVQQIEGKVIEISRLQEIFTDKILQQEQELNRVNATAVNATENVRGGNEQLREAMKKNAGFRVWILFFIITLAFTIIFLDWYNP
ncbi:syntaxin-18-like protein [Dinothrombium tinctorium]|uniref:Syntaxin-18 n=1 Tax=Dinothrombium tinctorium TaxID=1965070 RepID=A0A443R1N7_9ACAR|nr:syntaxin-18-like protein [Dinothrombium tinctorium]